MKIEAREGERLILMGSDSQFRLYTCMQMKLMRGRKLHVKSVRKWEHAHAELECEFNVSSSQNISHLLTSWYLTPAHSLQTKHLSSGQLISLPPYTTKRHGRHFTCLRRYESDLTHLWFLSSVLLALISACLVFGPLCVRINNQC